MNDQTLLAKVRSEVLGGARWADQHVLVDACDAVITLRGVVDDPDSIADLCDAVAAVDGVRAVETHLHRPGTRAPNLPDRGGVHGGGGE